MRRHNQSGFKREGTKGDDRAKLALHVSCRRSCVFRSFSSLFPHHPWGKWHGALPAFIDRAVPLEAYPRYHLARSCPFSDHAEESMESMREHSKQKTHIWFLSQGLLQNLTDSPGSFTCSFCGLAPPELVHDRSVTNTYTQNISIDQSYKKTE